MDRGGARPEVWLEPVPVDGEAAESGSVGHRGVWFRRLAVIYLFVSVAAVVVLATMIGLNRYHQTAYERRAQCRYAAFADQPNGLMVADFTSRANLACHTPTVRVPVQGKT
jgi:hypothetical protein